MSGELAGCDSAWCVDGVKLDLGSANHLAATAAHDYDLDGTVETNAEEVTGLVGTSVSLKVATGSVPVKVYLINTLTYRNADGSFA